MRDGLRVARASITAIVLLGLIAGCGDDEGPVASDSSSTSTSTTSTPSADPTSTTLADPVVLSAVSLGALRIGMTQAEAEATGLLGGDWGPGCELGGPGLEVAKLAAPIDGTVGTSDGVVNSIYVRGGVITAPGDLAVGDPLSKVEAIGEPYAVSVDRSLEEVFGIWSVDVTHAEDGLTLQFAIDPETEAVDAIGVPFIPFCE